MGNYKLALLFTIVIALEFACSRIQVYRYGVRDVFQNPKLPSPVSFSECNANVSCKGYMASCFEAGYCCLCRCMSKYSTFSVGKGRCVNDEIFLRGASFRFIRNGKILSNIQLHELTEAKDLGLISNRDGVSTPLVKCRVVESLSKYLQEYDVDGWKRLRELSKKQLFKLSHGKDGLILKWNRNATRSSKFQGLVIRLVIHCAAINSSIVFKTWKNYNAKNFIGCIAPKRKLTHIRTLHTCDVMTPSLCKDFCRALGRSLALLRGATNCLCGEFSQVQNWKRDELVCVLPCPGDPSKLCGGNESYSAYRTMPEWPNDFQFSTKGRLNFVQYYCTAITEAKDYRFWNNTFFCSQRIGKPFKFTWISKKRERILTKQRCIKIKEPKEPDYSSWKNNYFCVKREAPLTFRWSYSGPILGKECIQWRADDPDGWDNNFLCADRPKRKEINETQFCPTSSNHPSSVILPSKTISPSPYSVLSSSSLLLPSPLSTISRTQWYSSSPRSFRSVQNISSRSKNNADEQTVTFYVVLPLAFILSGFLVGVLTLLHCKRRKVRDRSNAPVEGIDFVNPASSNNHEMEENGETQNHPRRKSRMDRLPSLPDLNTTEQPNLSHESPNAHEIPATTSSPYHEELSVVNDEMTPQENNIYETPVSCGFDDIPLDIPSDAQLVERLMEQNIHLSTSSGDIRSTENTGDIKGLRHSPTYETIPGATDHDTLYLEVLP